MAAPAYAAAGAGASADIGSTDPAPAYPTGISEGHLLLLQACTLGTGIACATPAGWALLHGPDGSLATLAQWVFAKSASGSESGTLTVNMTGDDAGVARIYRFTDWLNDATMANNFEGASLSGPTTSTTIEDAGVTTAGVDRLGVNFVATPSNQALDAFTGETGGDWTEAVAEYAQAIEAVPSAIGLQTATLAAAGTVNGGTDTITSAYWVVRGFAIKPAGIPLSNFYPDYTEFPKPKMRTVTA